MIVWISLVAAILILFGGQHVDASHHIKMSLEATSTASANPSQETSGSSFFNTDWTALDPSLSLNTTYTLFYTVTSDVGTNFHQQARPSLVLLWTNTPSSTTPNASNTWEVMAIQYACEGSCTWNLNSRGSTTFNLWDNPGTLNEWSANPGNFFLCFATPPVAQAQTCESYSPFFNIDVSFAAQIGNQGISGATLVPTPATSLQRPGTVMALIQTTPLVTSSGGIFPTSRQPLTPSPSSTSFASVITVSNTPTGTTTITPVATSPGAASPSAVPKGGLPTAAKVGIIVGAIGATFLAVLLALLCLRRRRRTRRQSEQVLLTQNMHTESRDLITEKDTSSPGGLSSILETPLSRPAILPQNPRHSYDSLNTSAPYKGPAAAIPRRKVPSPITQEFPQHQTRSQSPRTPPPRSMQQRNPASNSFLARGISDASAGPISPRSTLHHRSPSSDFGEIEHEHEPYHDVPIYGDARHIPQVYQTSSSLQAPFLSEPGMSAEEIRALEEEERRIDAAIAEAERGGVR